MTESNPAILPLGTSISEKLKNSQIKKLPLQNLKACYTLGHQLDQEQTSTVAFIDSANNTLQDPSSLRPSDSSERRTIFPSHSPTLLHKDHPSIRKLTTLDRDPGKISQRSVEVKLERHFGDNSEGIAPEEVGENVNQDGDVSLPVSLKEDSSGTKSLFSLKRAPRPHNMTEIQVDTNNLSISGKKSQASSKNDLSEKPKEGFFQKGLTKIKSGFKGKKQVKVVEEMDRRQSKVDVTPHIPDVTIPLPTFPVGHSLSELRNKTDDKGPRHGNVTIETCPGKTIDDLHSVSQVKGVSFGKGTTVDLSNKDEGSNKGSKNDMTLGQANMSHLNLIKAQRRSRNSRNSKKSSAIEVGSASSFRSPLERRTGSDRLQIDQAYTVTRAVKLMNFKIFLKYSFVVIIFMIFSFIALSALSSLIAFPYEDYELQKWIGQLFHGYFLAILMFTFVKAAMRIARNEAEHFEEQLILGSSNAQKLKKEYKDGGLYCLAVFLIIISGLIMVGLAEYLADDVAEAFRSAIPEFVILILNAVIYTLHFLIKNNNEKKNAHKFTKQGFFFVPVYKHFMADIMHTRAALQTRTERTRTDAEDHRDIETRIKEEGIDKYKPLQAYEVVTAAKIFGSQLIVIVAYIQLIAVTGLIKLYDSLIDENKVAPGVILVLAFPLFMCFFTKMIDLINNFTEVDMEVHAYYINTAFAAMFCRVVAFHYDDMKFVYVMIACKGAYKLVVYLLCGLKIDYLMITLMGKIQSTFSNIFRKKANEEARAIRRAYRTSLKYLGRPNTITEKQLYEINHDEEMKTEKLQDFIRGFVLRFTLVGANDILYSVCTISLLLGHKWLKTDKFFSLAETNLQSIYMKAAYGELILDAVLLMVIGLCWLKDKKYKFLPVNGALKRFFREFAIDFVVISLALILTFVFLVQAVEVKTCCS